MRLHLLLVNITCSMCDKDTVKYVSPNIYDIDVINH